MSRRRLGIAVVLVTVLVTVLWIVPSQAQPQVHSESYAFGVWEPGLYHIKVKRFKRYGPEAERILAKNDPRFGPETAVIDTFVEVREGKTHLIRTETKSEDGELLYADEAPPQPPSGAAQSSPGMTGYSKQARADMGFHVIAQEVFSGRVVEVFVSVGDPPPTQAPPGERGAVSPVYYDLTGIVGTRVVQWVDKETGVTLRMQRIAVHDSGAETLLEDWQTLMAKREG